MANLKICSIDGCGKKHFGRGFCNMHYSRVVKHGDPHALHKTPHGAPREYLNLVVLAYEGDECLTWPFQRNNHGYGIIDGRVVSRVVCQEVNGEPSTDSHQAAHSCGNGHLGCVNKRHISWKTPTENMADKIIHGTNQQGESNHQTILTEQDVRRIISMKGERTQIEISRMFGISFQHVSDIHRGKRWVHLQKEKA